MGKHCAAMFAAEVKRNAEAATGRVIETVPTVSGLIRLAAVGRHRAEDWLPRWASQGEHEQHATQRRA